MGGVAWVGGEPGWVGSLVGGWYRTRWAEGRARWVVRLGVGGRLG